MQEIVLTGQKSGNPEDELILCTGLYSLYRGHTYRTYSITESLRDHLQDRQKQLLPGEQMQVIVGGMVCSNGAAALSKGMEALEHKLVEQKLPVWPNYKSEFKRLYKALTGNNAVDMEQGA